jgi:hypothetical protein
MKSPSPLHSPCIGNRHGLENLHVPEKVYTADPSGPALDLRQELHHIPVQDATVLHNMTSPSTGAIWQGKEPTAFGLILELGAGEECCARREHFSQFFRLQGKGSRISSCCRPALPTDVPAQLLQALIS